MRKNIKKVWNWIKSKIKKFINWLFEKNQGGVSGSGSSDKTLKYSDINLVRATKDAIGVGYHRTGWPWVLDHLSTIHSKSGIIFDDFLEQNFCYKEKPTIYKEPWVAIFHHPKNIPSFGNYRENLSVVFESKEFKESVKNLKVAIALSDELADWLRTQLDCDVVSMKHPINIDTTNQWDYEAWDNNKKLYQIGFYLRNTRLVEQIPNIDGVDIKRLWGNMDWLESYDTKVGKHWDNHFTDSLMCMNESYFTTRYNYRSAEDHSVEFVLPSKYDDILRESVVIADYFECSASNVILECISGNTPIIINRLPSTEQYLGEEYPLFFNHPEEIPSLLCKVKEAHDYLRNLDKSDLDIDYFKKQILRVVNNIKR